MSNQRFAKIELGKGQQTETKMKSGRSPQWYEEFDLDVWNVDERVNIEIYDWDKDEQHRFLGNVSVPVQELVYADDGITDREYDLLDEEGNPSKSSISLRFAFRQVRCTGELTVMVERARNLPRMDTFGLADPFAGVTCGKGTRHKTKVIKNNLNPEWKEEFIFNVEESARELKIVLYDWSFTKEEDFIGQIQIPTSDIEERPVRDEWIKLKDIDGTTDAKGELKIKMRFIPEHERDSTAIRFRRNPASWPVGEKSDFNHYAPVGQIKFFGRTLLRGKCKHCNKRRFQHAKNLRCDLGIGNYFHSLTINKAQTLLACGTGDGRIRISMITTGQQIACWTAHSGPVMGLQFAHGDERLLSWGADYRFVSSKDYFHGSFIPLDPSSSTNQGKRSCVEMWFVASMIRALDIYRKKNLGLVDDDQGENANEDEESEEEDEDFSYDLGDDDDDDDDTLTEEEKDKLKKAREAKLAKAALGMKGRRGKGGQQGLLPGARVGYHPVYYPPPILSDGAPARSCLKGRGRTNAMREGLSWGPPIPMHFYPPENPDLDAGAESDDSDSGAKKSRKAKAKQPGELSAAEKKRIAEEKQRERAKQRQAAKDAALFGSDAGNIAPLKRSASFETLNSPPDSRSSSPERTPKKPTDTLLAYKKDGAGNDMDADDEINVIIHTADKLKPATGTSPTKKKKAKDATSEASPDTENAEKKISAKKKIKEPPSPGAEALTPSPKTSASKKSPKSEVSDNNLSSKSDSPTKAKSKKSPKGDKE